MNAIATLKGLSQRDVDGRVLDELVGLSASAKQLQAEYVSHGIDVPAWVDDSLRILQREITTRNADQLQQKLAQLDAEAAGLETRDEKRQRITREREALQRRLGITPNAAQSGSLTPEPVSTT